MEVTSPLRISCGKSSDKSSYSQFRADLPRNRRSTASRANRFAKLDRVEQLPRALTFKVAGEYRSPEHEKERRRAYCA